MVRRQKISRRAPAAQGPRGTWRRRPALPTLERLEDRLALTAEPNGPEFLVNENPDFQQRGWLETSRSVAMDADGDFVVAWSSYGQDGSGYGVYARQFNAAGEAIGPEFRVSTQAFENQLFPVVAMDDDGDFVVAWNSYGQDGNGYGVYYQRFNSSGEKVGDETRANSGTTAGDQDFPSISMNSAGEFVIAWRSEVGGARQIRAQRYSADGTGGGEITVGDSSADGGSTPSVAIDDNGGFVVAWTSVPQSGNTNILARRYDSAGAALGEAFPVNVSTPGDQTSAVVAADEAGHFVVAWASENQDGGSWGIYSRRFAADGTALDVEDMRVNTTTANAQEDPSIARAPSGTYVVTWTSALQDASGAGIFGQLFNANGTKSGPEFRVNTTTAGNQRFSSVDMDDEGDFVAVWSSYNQASGGSAYDIYAQRYAPNKPPVPDPGGPYVIQEGQGLQLDGSGSFDPDGDSLSYAWDIDGDMDFNDGLTTPTMSLTLAQLVAINPALGDGPSPDFQIRLRLDDGKDHVVISDPVPLTVENVAPTIALAGPPTVAEGEVYQLTLGAITDPGPDTVTQWVVDWGDGNIEPFASGGVKSHQYTSIGEKSIHVSLVDEDGTHHDAGTRTVDVQDTPPEIALEGNPQTNEGQLYTLTLGQITDPGGVTVTQWIVRWGDGQMDTYNAGGQVTHTYADNLGAIAIRVDLVDATGTHENAGTLPLTVNNVRPTIAVTGAASTNEGALYTLGLGAITDPGTDTVTQYIVNWGDGQVEQFTAGGFKSHTYQNGPLTVVIRVDLVDEDGTHTGAATKIVQVNNVLPSLTIDGPDGLNEGQVYTLDVGAVVDPGADVVSGYIVDWGDGTEPVSYSTPGPKMHTYLKSNPNTLIKVSIQDNDGLHPDRATKTINVADVAPTIALAGPASRAEGAPYPLTLGAITDPGDDVVSQWIVDWGDGTAPEVFTSGGVKNHVYADDSDEVEIKVSIMDGDGTHADAGSKTIAITNVRPQIAILGADAATEGISYELTLGDITDPGADTVTQWIVDWGDGRTQTYTSGGVKTHMYEDGPNQHTIRVDLVDEDGVHDDVATKLITVNNVAPTVVLTGANSSNEGSSYALTMGAVTDTGDDTVTEYHVDWGDGTSEMFASGGVRMHTYADDGDYTIRVHLLDEDGLHENAGVKQIAVQNVAPTVVLTGANSSNEGSSYALTMGAVTDTGDDTVTEYHVDWGDGTSEMFASGGVRMHTYADDGDYTIRVHLLDEDGLHENAGVKQIAVQNVAPTVVLTGANSSNEGWSYALTMGAVTDPGADTVTQWIVDWGDGTSEMFASGGVRMHTYADDGDYTIRVHLLDEDGLHENAGVKQIAVQNVAPAAPVIGEDLVVQGQEYTLSIGDIVDPGADTVTGVRVDWGDGNTSILNSAGPWTHIYEASTGPHNIKMSLIDEDGEFAIGTQAVRVLIPGDTNADGTVDLGDFNTLKGNFGQPGGRDAGDANGDGQVDLSDFNLLKANFGQTEDKPSVPGDANGDGNVNLADFNILKSAFGASGVGLPADFNKDDSVNLADFNILKENFGAAGSVVNAESASDRLHDLAIASFSDGWSVAVIEELLGGDLGIEL